MEALRRSLAALAFTFMVAGCTGQTTDPSWATQPYPAHLHNTQVTDMHVFRRDTNLELANSTATTFTDFHLWINQRYVRHVDSLPAGATIMLSLWDFHDEFGDRFNAGGFFRSFEHTPVRLVQIQTHDDQPLLGTITIRSEPAPLPRQLRP